MSLATATHSRVVEARPLPVDEDGFLIDPGEWNRVLAQQLASVRGLGTLDEIHWRMIDFARDRYNRLGALPPMRHLCRKVGVDRAAVKRAFGSCRDLWQIAGLPHPGEEVLTYMG